MIAIKRTASVRCVPGGIAGIGEGHHIAGVDALVVQATQAVLTHRHRLTVVIEPVPAFDVGAGLAWLGGNQVTDAFATHVIDSDGDTCVLRQIVAHLHWTFGGYPLERRHP